jgi:aspartate racemase
MKRLGLVGIGSAQDLEIYWSVIRSEAEKTLGPGRAPEIVVYSVGTLASQQALRESDWEALAQTLANAGTKLAGIGAEGLVVCGSALNPAAPALRRQLRIPVVDIGQSVTAKLQALRYRRVAVLGIRTSQEAAMWADSLAGIKVVVPDGSDRDWLLTRADAAIRGHAPTVEWKIETNRIVASLRRAGAQALILADSALARWIKPGDAALYPIDAAEIHAWTASLWALQDGARPAPPCILGG